MQEIFPESQSLPDVLKRVVGREVTSHVEDDDPQAALDLIGAMTSVLPETVTADLKVLAYDRWGKGKTDSDQWEEAIRIYDMGLLEVPHSRVLNNNRNYAASKP
jgi:hypothetical protein